MKKTWRNVGILVAGVLLVVLGILLSEKRNQQLLKSSSELEDFLMENGKLVELFDEGVTEDGTPILITETGGIPIYEHSDKVEAMSDVPVLLYYPNATEEICLHFEMNLSPRFKEYELYKGEELVPSDPDKEHYYFLDLKEKGNYLMEIRYSDPDAGEGHIYFSIAW